MVQAVELWSVRAAKDPLRKQGVGEERDQDAAVLATQCTAEASLESGFEAVSQIKSYDEGFEDH